MVDILLNNQSLELDNDIELNYTLQVNDIGDVATRQASYISSIKLPKTKNNTQIMQGLGLVGDTSRVPYQKPTCQVIDDGFSIIPNGWAVIKNTNDYYNLSIYNGIINFFKAIENKTLGIDLDLSLINHNKTVAKVIESFTHTLPYRYLLGDYNGRTHYDADNKILIDYLPPSANVKYLWNLIFSTFGFTYSGATFDTDDFNDWWLTYPKGVEADTNNNPTIEVYDRSTGFNSSNNGISFDVNTGIFLVSVTQTLIIEEAPNSTDPFVSYYIYFYRNGVRNNYPPNNQYEAGDTFYVTIQFHNGGLPTSTEEVSILGVTKIFRALNTISFSEELKEFKITDFVKEVLTKYCLTMFTNDHTNEITFKTIKERVETADIIDWTDKYVERTNESYIYDTYAQKNNFEYQYNDKEDAHNDGSILINNVNINASASIWKSVTYSPLKETNDNFIVGSGQLPPGQRIFKQYDKEIKENATGGVQEIKYKPLSKRFYFLHSKPEYTPVGNVVFGSIKLNNSLPFSGATIPVANFNQLDMNSIIGASYLPMQTILNDSRLHTIKLALSKFDIMNLNFDTLYYFAQEQQNYILNKINFKNKDYSIGELVRVKKADIIIPNSITFITFDNITVVGCVVTINYTTDAQIGTQINLVCSPNDFGQVPPPTFDSIYYHNKTITTTGTSNTATFTLDAGYFYEAKLNYSNLIFSNVLGFDNNAGCILINPTQLIITAVTLINSYVDTVFQSVVNVYKIDFTTDAILPRNIYVQSFSPLNGIFGGWTGYSNNGIATTGTTTKEIGTFLVGNTTKVQIKIGTFQSNEFTI